MIPNTKTTPEDTIILKDRQVLFEQGDQGGDLFIIESGEIEIYTVKDGADLVLDIMTAGEIIGTLTFLTKQARLANARSRGQSVIKKIGHLHANHQIRNLPFWLKIVLKDFIHRINSMNTRYLKAKEEIKDLEKDKFGYIRITQQICTLTAHTAPKFAQDIDGKQQVFLPVFTSYVEDALGLPGVLVERLFATLTDSGMLKTTVEPEKKKKIFTTQAAQKLTSFATFIADADKGHNRTIMEANIPTKELKILMGLVSFAKRMGMNLSSECELDIDDLKASLEKMIGIAFDEKLMKTAARLHLVKQKKGSNKIFFTPQELSRTLTNVRTYKKIARMEEVDREKGQFTLNG